MSIKVALNHRTHYSYDRPVQAGPQIVRLRPAPHCRTPIQSYSLKISPDGHFINWQQDPFGNFNARVIFEKKISHLTIEVDLVADMSVINPFDFFVTEAAEKHPFEYSHEELEELKPYLATDTAGPRLTQLLSEVDHDFERTIDFLVGLNQRLQEQIEYLVRMEPGVQTCEETLEKQSGSCRDSAWLLVQILRHQGLAARFTSGYLIQLESDVKSLDGPSGADSDFTDLHAWTEVYLPGAGWVGLDPTSGLLAGEGHLPLASTPKFTTAAAVSGAIDDCESEFEFSMSVTRIHEDPRVTKPYTAEQWSRIDTLGNFVDEKLLASDVRLTMGGEPTFVSVDHSEAPEWQTEAIGEEKNRLANELMNRLKQRFGRSPLLHYGQGKWYPGEPIPRWSKTCYWRDDGQPLWQNQNLIADEGANHNHNNGDAEVFIAEIADRLNVDNKFVATAYEDAIYHLWQEQRLPTEIDLNDPKIRNDIDRKRLARVLENGLDQAAGYILPLIYDRHSTSPGWKSGQWKTRTDRINLIPGDSPLGFRLPIKSLSTISEFDQTVYGQRSPFESRDELPEAIQIRQRIYPTSNASRVGNETNWIQQKRGGGIASSHLPNTSESAISLAISDSGFPDSVYFADTRAIPFALCVEVRNGTLHVFMPPTDRLEQYLEILAAVEDAASDLNQPVLIEGYKPPKDHRLRSFSITPDPGVIEVNVQPAESWDELKAITNGLYEDAFQCRLGTEKFDTDGTHSGTGGGNHIVLGGPTPVDSPLLRRPDLLRSLVGFWQNHPSLSYLFSSKFVGPTSQAPRVDEGRNDALYELQIAFDELERQTQSSSSCAPWLVDRIFRNLLIDLTGNTHRAEFCIDKLYSPDTASGRLGLLEFRGFEMPPHQQMSLTQQLLIRTLVAKFWESPYREKPVDWRTRLHDQFMLPHFIWRDFSDVITICQQSGYDLDSAWFDSHFEFRFPFIGGFTNNSLNVELRQAIEPWNVLGEETTVNGTSRYVDSSVERIEVKVTGYVDERYVISCNGYELPMHPTETLGQYVAGVRYRAWQPPSCLHPTIAVDGPLTFDLYDRWLGRSVDGCRYYVGHPGGLNPNSLPVNSYEAESRRAARFSRLGNSGVGEPPKASVVNSDFPMTLDLRKVGR